MVRFDLCFDSREMASPDLCCFSCKMAKFDLYCDSCERVGLTCVVIVVKWPVKN